VKLVKFLLLECQLDWYNHYLCIHTVSVKCRTWLDDLRIQTKVPRLPGARLNPCQPSLSLSEADKTGSKKLALCMGWGVFQ
jgi:hypothetical protein